MKAAAVVAAMLSEHLFNNLKDITLEYVKEHYIKEVVFLKN